MSDFITVEVHEELRTLVPQFLENRRRDVEQLARHLAVGDFDALLQIAHNMKGVGSGYGFHEVTALGARLEEAGHQSDPSTVAQCVAEYRNFIEHCRVVFV